MCWIFATVGMAVGDPETAQAAAFPVLAPLVFASTLFVDSSTMPGWLAVWADHQPVSVTAKAVRYLTLGDSPLGRASDLWAALAWIAGILVVFAPLAVRRYRRAI
jgi:ABC-type multidrug transport system permease subunit